MVCTMGFEELTFFKKNVSSKRLPRRHKCTICKELFYWNDESRWYGVLEDEFGNEKVIEKICSSDCLDKSKYKEDDYDFTL